MSESHLEGYDLKLCLIGEELRTNESFIQTCKTFEQPLHFSLDGSDYVDEDNTLTVFVVDSFKGEVFERLQNERRHILGVPAVLDLAASNMPLLVKTKPVYCLALVGCYLVISGYRHKSDLARLLKLIHTMGGSVVKDVGKKVTHVLSKSSIGEKYNYATTFSIPVLTEDWLLTAWDNRENLGYRANVKEMHDKYKLPPFAGNIVCFYGFDAAELEHMTEILVANGGRVAEGGDKGCEDHHTTHLVVDENSVELLPPDLNVYKNCAVVKGEWFWNSIQIQAAAAVSTYRWREGGLMSPANKSVFSPPTPTSLGASRKRKRMRRAEMINALATDSPAHKRRSSISELGLLSMSGSFLDSTERNMISPEPERGSVVQQPTAIEPEMPIPSFNLKTATPRQQVFHELVTTESNYVGILDCVTKISQEAEDASQQGGALLDQQEMKIIFGNLPPIRKVHTEMLKRLQNLENNWTEDLCIGSIILDFAGDMLKAYPPFVNFFERSKTQIQETDRRSPRFHAFLKKCERSIECSRQSLTELMIRPVQRLPSVSLLLNDLLKHTKRAQENHPDIVLLEQAILKVKTVMTHLNEEKRRTEGQITIFDIYSEIENCPANIVSSHRSFVCRCECVEVAAEDILCGKGYELTLFLFTDVLLIAKKKAGKMGGILRSPSTTSLAAGAVGQASLMSKSLKFVTLIHLSAVRRLVDILDYADMESGVIAIVCRQTEDLRERCFTLQILSEVQDDKVTFLRTICRHVANTLCRPDAESLLVRLGARDMSLEASDLSVSTLSRTFSSLYKTKQKVGRAFSFNKTPSKLKRAVSTMISPMAGSATLRSESLTSATLGRHHHTTPSEGLRDLRIENEGSDVFGDMSLNFDSGEVDLSSTGTPKRRMTPLSRGMQSCVNLGDSPRTSRTHPVRLKMDSLDEENKDPEFRTPNLCSRPSFRDKFRARSGTFAAFHRKPSNNQ